MGSHDQVIVFNAGDFEASRHYYTRVLNAQLHPLVKGFLAMSHERIAERFCHLRPMVAYETVLNLLRYRPKYLRWGGADLFCVTNDQGQRKMVVIELNSCPSGQKSQPLTHEIQDQGGYRLLLERAFLPALKNRTPQDGVLAVLYDKNFMECSGYASCLAELTGKPVYLVPCYEDAAEPRVRFSDGFLEIRDQYDRWLKVRAALRYVTQRPWTRIPPLTRTFIFNPVLVCLAGGRNKMLAAKAYADYNQTAAPAHLGIRTPHSIWDVALAEVPALVERLGGIAVVKNPYSNAGQGVYTITHADELADFMATPHSYQRFIVQALIGNASWSSGGTIERLYHLGTVPDSKRRIYVADLRFMIGVGEEGFFPTALYARRAKDPLRARLEEVGKSWDMLGTNLSYRDLDGEWQAETNRLMLMDNRDFNQLGLGLDDLIEGFLQTVQAAIAVDRMAQQLLNSKGKFNRTTFRALNPDEALIAEICS